MDPVAGGGNAEDKPSSACVGGAVFLQKLAVPVSITIVL